MKNLLFLLFLIISISSCDGQVNNIKNAVSQSNTIKSKENILTELDRIFNRLNFLDSASMSLQSPDYMFFLDLEHGDVVTAGSRIHLPEYT